MSDIHFVETLIVKPGDQVLVRVDPQDMDRKNVVKLGELLKDRYPQVDFTVLAVRGQLMAVRDEE